MGQCSSAVERDLESDQTFKTIREQSDSISLIKLLEKMCYSYQAHEYMPLGVWNALDVLTSLRQPDEVLDVNHYETFWCVTEMCKASGINFAVLCSANVNMVIQTLADEGKLVDVTNNTKIVGTYEDGIYFTLTKEQRTMVDKVAENICLSIRFLSPSSNLLHSGR